MKIPRVTGDVLLAVFAVVVFTSCVLVIQRAGAPAEVSTVTQAQNTPDLPLPTSSRAAPTPTPSPAVTPSGDVEPGTIVVAGPDLAKLGADLVAASGDTVLVAESAGQDPLAEGALEAIKQTPAAVVIQVLAGSSTSARTTDAVAAVRARWRTVPILVVGPFSSEDRKSAAAVKSAAAEAKVTFLDPVELGWRANAVPAAVAEADYPTIAEKLAAAMP